MAGELISFAAEQQKRFDSATSLDERKQRGHFGTPAAIADFMAGMFRGFPRGSVRILDPGAGVGTLSAAICERAIKNRFTSPLYFELWENDPKLLSFLESTMGRCRRSLQAIGCKMDFAIRSEDFILSNTRKTLFNSGPEASFDWIVLNPPYFKLRKESPQAQAMSHVVHGQPNIYTLFMAVAADLLLPGGEMVAITPRSYFNGPYFKLFRKWFFDRLTPRQIHVFESRTEAFKEDAVLQENVILRAEKGGRPQDVVLTNSLGRELLQVSEVSSPYEKIIDNRNGDNIVRVTTNSFEDEIIAVMDRLPNRFRDHGFEISTGPVVTFRCTGHLRHERASDTAPLLWMHNVRPFVIQFPPKNGKPTHIAVSESSKKLLVPAKTYLLLKRFTSKEEKRRLVAGIVTAKDSYSEWVGLENHLNYVYRRNREFSRAEAIGLAAFFNSALVDRYFRAISGNTQVNATEIRTMPVPAEKTLLQIGFELKQLNEISIPNVERIVGQALCLPEQLIHQLAEVA